MPEQLVDESKAYRRALGAFATGVAVVATAGGPNGAASAITVNSFTSVSLEPRLVLWCLDDGSDRYDTFAGAETWGISVLERSQEGLSSRFARQGGHEIQAHEVIRTEGAALVLPGALAQFTCRTYATHVMGDHLVIVGEVLDFAAAPGEGLTYFRGKYGVAPNPEA
jgi:3-hydroxy-9,10-secoandrosta-1,3,5(10)-triene-9,17-dione monooxygenase reductase component